MKPGEWNAGRDILTPMKTIVFAALALALALALAGCAQKSQADDEYETLIHHLLKRTESLNQEISAHDKTCRDEELSLIRGGRLADKGLNMSNFDRMDQDLIDFEAFTELHNRRHPESQWAYSKELLKSLCGDCARERAIRNVQMKEEAAKK